MKTKVISVRDWASIKKMAQIVNPLVSKKNNILKKIDTLMNEIEGPGGLNEQIAGMEAGIKARFLGLGTEQLVKKVITPYVREDGTPVLDAKTGKQLTRTTYEPLECLVYDKENNNYVLTVIEEGDEVITNTETSSVDNNENTDLELMLESEQPTEKYSDNPFNF